MLAPVCLFVYSRLEETMKCVKALQKNTQAHQSHLFIFSDGPKNAEVNSKVQIVREYLNSVKGFKSVKVIKSRYNKGLANSIISGVGQVLKQFPKVIVLEDDLITSSNFLNFMNQALEFYGTCKKIQSVNGYSLNLKSVGKSGDVYFQKRPFSWGWGTWTDRWNETIFDKQLISDELAGNSSLLKKFEKACGSDIGQMLLYSINNKNDSWYVRWAFAHFMNQTYSVYPRWSFVENIGFGKLGTHCKGVNSFYTQSEKNNKLTFSFTDFREPGKKTTREFLNYFRFPHKALVRLKLLTQKGQSRLLLYELKLKILSHAQIFGTYAGYLFNPRKMEKI